MLQALVHLEDMRTGAGGEEASESPSTSTTPSPRGPFRRAAPGLIIGLASPGTAGRRTTNLALDGSPGTRSSTIPCR